MIKLHAESKLTAAQTILCIENFREMAMSREEIVERLDRKGLVLLHPGQGVGVAELNEILVKRMVDEGIDDSEMQLGDESGNIVSDLTKKRFAKSLGADQMEFLNLFLKKASCIVLKTETDMTFSISGEPKEILVNLLQSLITE